MKPAPIDAAFEVLKDAYRPPVYESVSVCGGLWDIGQWIAYCTHCKPVPFEEFQGMQGEHANRKRWMPAFDQEAVERAIHGMPDCEIKALMSKRLGRL